MLSVFKFTSVPNTQRLTTCWAQQRIWLLCSRCPLQHTLNHDSRRFMACPRRRKWLDPDLGKKLGGYLGRPLPWWQMAARLWVVGRAGGNGTLGSLREFFLVSEEIQQEEMERFKALQFEECIMYIFFKKKKKSINLFTSQMCTIKQHQSNYAKSCKAPRWSHGWMAVWWKSNTEEASVNVLREDAQPAYMGEPGFVGVKCLEVTGAHWGGRRYEGMRWCNNTGGCWDKNKMSLNFRDICWCVQGRATQSAFT